MQRHVDSGVSLAKFLAELSGLDYPDSDSSDLNELTQWQANNPGVVQFPPLEYITQAEQEVLKSNVQFFTTYTDFFERMAVEPKTVDVLLGKDAPWREWEDKPLFTDWEKRLKMKPLSTKAKSDG